MTADSERLADLLELAQDWLWEVDAEGRFVYLSPGAAADLGVPAEALIGRPWRQAVPPRGGVEAWERHLATLAARAPFRDTLLPLYDGDGSSRTLRCSGKPLFDADGAFRGYRGIARDATEAMLAERKYRALFEHAPIGISVEDLTGQYLDSNPALAAMLGFTDAEMAEMSHLAVTAPEGLMQYLPRVAEMMAGERPRVDVTVRQRRKDGGALWVRLCAAPIRDLQGTPRQVVCMAVDISDLIGAQEMLLRRHIAIESSVDGIAICDAAGRLTYLNGAQAQLYGYDGPDAMVGLAWSALYGDGEGERFRHEIRAALAAEGRWRGEAAGRRRDGAEFPQELSLTALEGGGFVAITRDITARRRAEAEQAQLRERMHRSQRLDALGRLASGVAHDFNNVLAAILNYAGVLEQEVPPGHPLREAVEAIRGAGDHGVA
ncbi:MAG TPA: PAS domain S-box protein, partial [Alphaproteobacteria bacterium]|nr:PAS domain S-box protein [Alphaproteobacteria bacterium]